MPKRSRQQQHQQPLYADDSSVASKKRSRAAKKHQEEDKMISTGMSSKILKEALIQQKEIQDEAEGQNPNSAFFAVTDERKATADGGEEDDIDAFDGFSETLSLYSGYANEEEIDEVQDANRGY